MSLDIFTDGSWRHSIPEYSGWAYIVIAEGSIIDQNSGVIECLSRQIDGELFATLAALYAIEHIINKYKVINLYYDYIGNEAWANGKWKANSVVSKEYIHEISLIPYMDKVRWIKVKSHSGCEGNDIVDALAKKALDSLEAR